MKISQLDFSGGMSALTDVTKPQEATYRLGFNLRLRKNAIEPAFRHRRIDSPVGLHQAAFANDNTLGLIVAGSVYKVKLDQDVCIAQGGTGVISSTADRVYHKAVPAPSNWVVNSQYQPTLSVAEECIVVQDGINQPTLIFSDFSHRPAQTYDAWTYEDPEYIPIGTFMSYSGRKLFIANGAKIYQSVSGRPLDFVLNIDNNGNKQGTADTTHLAVTAARLTAIVPSQTSGLVVFTRYNSYSLEPEYQLPTIFGEPQYIPSDLFPVGAVNDLAFAFVNGESLFISPAGIQSFNQVLQVQRASNNTPYGAKIVDYLIRPIESTATIMVEDYTFIAVNTVFGPAVLVHDNVLNAFVGFDLTLGIVKEFATIEDAGLTRVFYITANALYEIPLRSGSKASAAVYFGEFSTGESDKQLKIADVHLGFNNIRSTGQIDVQLWTDKILFEDMRQAKQLNYTAGGDLNLLSIVPQRLPIAVDMESATVSFDYCNSKFGYTSGVMVTVGADARLVSATFIAETKEVSSSTPQLEIDSLETIYFYGRSVYDEEFNGDTSYSLTIGKKYVLYAPSVTEELVNGAGKVKAQAGTAVVFTAMAEFVYCAATAIIYDYESFLNIAVPSAEAILLPSLGGLNQPYPLQALTLNLGLDPRAVLGSAELASQTIAQKFYAAWKSYSQMRVEYAYANVFLFSDVTADLAVNGPAMSWLEGQIAAYGVGKFNIVCFPRAPYTSLGVQATDLRWPFDTIGVQLVISSDTVQNYERRLVNGVQYIVLATKLGALQLVLSENVIQGSYKSLTDAFTIIR